MFRYLINIRNWLLLGLAGNSTVIINAKIEASRTLKKLPDNSFIHNCMIT